LLWSRVHFRRLSFIILAGFLYVHSTGVCRADEQSEYFELADPIFTNAISVRVFSFPQPLYAGGAELTVEALGQIPATKEVNADFRKFLTSELTHPSSYMFGLRKATRFYADLGLIFEGPEPKNIFLISTEFKGGRLVLERPLNPRAFIVNLDPIFPRLLQQLNESLQ
jgi:hypothetical protein